MKATQIDDVAPIIGSPAVHREAEVVKDRLAPTPIEAALRVRMSECAASLLQIQRNLHGVGPSFSMWVKDLGTWAKKLEAE